MALPFCYLLSIVLVIAHAAQAMVYDNRFWPLYAQPFLSSQDARWKFSVRATFMNASEAFGAPIDEEMMEGEEIPVFQLGGIYDEVLVDQALRNAGVISESLFRSDMRFVTSHPDLHHFGFPFRQDGNISLQIGVFETFLELTRHLGIGGSFFAGKVRSHFALIREGTRFSPGEEKEILLINQKIHEVLKLTPPSYSATVISDTDLYARIFTTAHYKCKIRYLDVGLNLGVMIPTAAGDNFCNPAFIPVGGNKHFGMYAAFEGKFVLKEDLIFGLLLRVNKRFARSACYRMPVGSEPLHFGAIIGPARVNPGVTVIFSPRIQLDGLRNGLGVNLAYTLVHHFRDTWTDLRKDKMVPVNINALEVRSGWGSDYGTITGFYDFGYDKEDACHAPVISFTVDIPFRGVVDKRIGKTYAVSIRIESRL